MSTIDETLVEFDLDTLEPVSPTGIQGSDSSPSIEGIETSPSIENLPTDESDYSDEGDFNFYEIDTDSDEEELPTYPITNLDITHFENDLPELVLYDQDDIVSDWNHEILDSGPQSGPFLGHTETNINDPNGKPEVFSMECLMIECGQFYLKQLTLMLGQNVNLVVEIIVRTPLIQTTKNIAG